jgi:hypothetical protein
MSNDILGKEFESTKNGIINKFCKLPSVQSKPRTTEDVVAFVFCIFCIPLAILARCYAGMWLWFWFLVPLGLPPISMVHVFGVLTCLAFLYRLDEKEKKRSMTEHAARACLSVIMPLFYLGVGYLCQLMM